MNEIWQDIPCYDGKYSVSNFGNVRSNYHKNRRILKPICKSKKNNGYLTVRLYSNSVGKKFQIHRLVANAFLPNPNNFPIVKHKDGNRTNNKAENLEWCSTLSCNTYNDVEENVKRLWINNNMEEIWKDIPGYAGKYSISNFGNVRSNQYGKKRILKPMRNAGRYNGYLTVTLYNNSIGKKVKIHRLVAEAFLPNPNNLPIINHKDEDKTNNKVDNLEWCTKLYNNTYNGTRNRVTETYWRNHTDK